MFNLKDDNVNPHHGITNKVDINYNIIILFQYMKKKCARQTHLKGLFGILGIKAFFITTILLALFRFLIKLHSLLEDCKIAFDVDIRTFLCHMLVLCCGAWFL
jgi:hypothetical protein